MANALHPRSPQWIENAIATPLHALVRYYRVSQERAKLRGMAADRLADVGLTRRDVEWETARPFWQAQRDC